MAKKAASIGKAAKKAVKTSDGEQEFVSRAKPISEFPDIEEILPELAQESRELAIKIAELDKRRKELNSECKALLEIAGYPSISGDGWVVVRATGGGVASISPELLLKHGVSMKTIEKCTVYADKYEYVQVRGTRPGSSDFSKD